MGRKKIPIDWEEVDELFEAGCTGVEVAEHLAMHPETLYRRVEEEFNVGFTDYLRQKKAGGDAKIRLAQFRLATTGEYDRSMLIWLGKNRLGQTDKQQVSGPDGGAIKFEGFGFLPRSLSIDELEQNDGGGSE